MQKLFKPPTTPGARFKPPGIVYGRTAGEFSGLQTRKADGDEADHMLPAVRLHNRFLGRFR